MEIDCVMVWTTIAATTDGQRLASVLVERAPRGVRELSWRDGVGLSVAGAVEIERERQVVIKTTADRIPALKAACVSFTTYELPEFIVVPITAGSEPYLQWIRESAAG